MRFIILFIIFLFSVPCQAQIKEYEHLFDVNPDEEIPLVWRLNEEYQQAISDYDWHYDFSWNIPPVFDKEFDQNIKNFGNIEKRIDNPDEEALLRDIRRLPPEFYPYIGPVLHTLPGLSGKILDLPGIKETKHQFPKKIASKLAKIPDIEFVSPGLYLYLMPQIFGEGLNSLEFPQKTQPRHNMPPIRFKKKFIEDIVKQIPVKNFAINAKPKEEDLGTRHYTATATTPLSKADVKAFINTLDGLNNFQSDDNTIIQFISFNGLMSYWDEKNGIDKNVSYLKTMVNPCQTIARKIKWAGKRNEFQKIIGTQSFGLDDWAYTCDKTLKAYRAANLGTAEITSLNILKKGYAYKMINQYGYYTPEERQTHKYFIEAVIQTFQSNANDQEAVRPYKHELSKKLSVFGANILGTPLILP